MNCYFCGIDNEDDELEIDPYRRGFWCGFCDGYTYLDGVHAHRFTLILEDKQQKNTPAPAIGIKLKKQLSPLRYPGGKSKFIPYVYARMQSTKCQKLISPFAGGGSLELALLHAGAVQELIMNDLDFGIYALFWTIKHAPDDLISRIRSSRLSHNGFFKAQSIVKADYAGCTIVDAAWYVLLVNRLAYSGIFSANPLGGRRGKKPDLLSRWNPDDLCRRISAIHKMSDRITIQNMDACRLIEEAYWDEKATIFIDPPYVQKGQQLYRCFYTREQHIELCTLLDSLHQGMPGADMILCYDNDPLITELYEYPDVEHIGRVYSI